MVKSRCDKKRKLTLLSEKPKPRKMATIVLNHKLSNGILLIAISLFLDNSLQAQTYATKANGAWTSASIWQGGIVPTVGNISSETIINIKHIVSYPGSNISNKKGTYTLCINTSYSVKNAIYHSKN
jgi:hypothetical protein